MSATLVKDSDSGERFPPQSRGGAQRPAGSRSLLETNHSSEEQPHLLWLNRESPVCPHPMVHRKAPLTEGDAAPRLENPAWGPHNAVLTLACPPPSENTLWGDAA